MVGKNYYNILGVLESASFKEIKRAYYRLAHEHHPDKNDGDTKSEEKFKEITEAYEVLRDPVKRKRYDSEKETSFKESYQGREHRSYGHTFFENFTFGNIFDEFIQGFFDIGRKNTTHVEKGDDLRYNLEVDLHEIAFGAEKELEFPIYVTCQKCLGTGYELNSDVRVCHYCKGNGELIYRKGFSLARMGCKKCNGRGRFLEDFCKSCKGDGKIKDFRKITIRIPQGIETGTRLKIAGNGNAGSNGGSSGDLYVVIKIKKHPIFEREEDNIICEVPISFAQACLGDTIDIPTLEGFEKLRIPPGTQPETIFKLNGKGIAHKQRFGRGDQIVKIMLETVTNLNEKQKELFKEFTKIDNV